MFCERCGAEIENDAKYCRNCGAKLQGTQKTIDNNGVGIGSRYTKEDIVLDCTLCGGKDFSRDVGRLDSKWGFTSFKVVILTCKRCGHVELFNKGRSIFDFD